MNPDDRTEEEKAFLYGVIDGAHRLWALLYLVQDDAHPKYTLEYLVPCQVMKKEMPEELIIAIATRKSCSYCSNFWYISL